MSQSSETRALDDWAESFMEYTSMIPSPVIFRRWAAYSAIAGVLERRVWTNMAGKPLHPNTLVLLVANPGIGKTMAIDEVYELWAKVGGLNVAPSGLTKAAFLDQLACKTKTYVYDGALCYYNAMLLAVSEFGNLLPEYDGRFLNVIQDVYDCHSYPYEDRTRQKGLMTIDRAHVTMIAGTQPKYIGRILPDVAFGMGFTARLIMVYAGKGILVKLFGKRKKRDVTLLKKLRSDLKQMSKLVGEFGWETDAEEFLDDWNENKHKDAPKHPKLLDYNPRRAMHVAKIAMSFSISRSNELAIILSDVVNAKKLLLEAEDLMPEIFKEMTVSQDASEIEEIHMFMFAYCTRKEVETVPEHDLLHYMAKKVPVNRIDYFLKTMQAAGMIEMVGLNVPGKRKYKPKPKSRLS